MKRRNFWYILCLLWTTSPRSTLVHAPMHAVNYKIYSGHGDTGLPDGTAGTHPGYMATGGYQYDLAEASSDSEASSYNLVQASSTGRSSNYIGSSYLGTPLASASRSSGQLRAPGADQGLQYNLVDVLVILKR